MNTIEMKHVKGYEGRYAVTACGKIWCYPNTGNKRVPISGLFKKLQVQRRTSGRNKPYLQVKVGLSIKGVNKTYVVSRLVAKAFIPIDNPEQYVVNHINGDSTDNNMSNLEWITPQDNAKHAYNSIYTREQKAFWTANGKKLAATYNRLKRKLTNEQVVEIKDLLPIKSMRQIGKQFGVTGRTIALIRDGKTYLN